MGVFPTADLPSRCFDGICLHGPQNGRGPTVLFIPGGYHGAWCYEQWIPMFAEAGWAGAAVDLRGHGGLPQGPDFASTSIADFASDVHRAIRVIDGPVVLAGHSMGAAIAATASATMPVAGLILLAASPPGNVPGLEPLEPVPEGAPYGPVGEAVCRRRFFPAHGDRDITYLTRRLCPESPVALNERRRLRQHVNPHAIQAPVLCLSAEGDDPVLHAPDVDRRTADFFGAEFHILPGAGHCFMLDGDTALPARLMLDWLNRTFPDAKETPA
jgi:pimeloyl-ACP methyl ester carboxylesterase